MAVRREGKLKGLVDFLEVWDYVGENRWDINVVKKARAGRKSVEDTSR